MGGMIAAEMAALAPGRLQRLALIARRDCGLTIIRSRTSSPCCRSRCRHYLFHDAGGGRETDDSRPEMDDPEFLKPI